MNSVAEVLSAIDEVVRERLKDDINYIVFNDLMSVSSNCLHPLTDDSFVWGVNFDSLNDDLRNELDLFIAQPNMLLISGSNCYVTLSEWIDFIVLSSCQKEDNTGWQQLRDDRVFLRKVMRDFVCYDVPRLQAVLQADIAKNDNGLVLSLGVESGNIVASIYNDHKPVNGVFWRLWIKKLESIKVVGY